MDQLQHLKLLSEIPLFQDLDTDELSSLNSYLSEIEIKQDDVVFNEDDAGEFVCFVVDGTLDVIKKTLSGKFESIAQLSKGRSIGEMALVDNLRRSATIRAKTDVTLTVLTRKEFDRLLEDQPQIGIKILKYMARTLSLNLRRTSNMLSDSIDLSH